LRPLVVALELLEEPISREEEKEEDEFWKKV